MLNKLIELYLAVKVILPFINFKKYGFAYRVDVIFSINNGAYALNGLMIILNLLILKLLTITNGGSVIHMTTKRPIYPIHPGKILADELAELEISPAELARELHVPANRIYQIIHAKRAITADTALRLEQWLGIEAQFWLNLQKNYELDLAAEQIGEEIKCTIHRRPSSLLDSMMEACSDT